MILNFIIANLNAITLGIWTIFLFIIVARFYRPTLVSNISYNKLLLIAIAINIIYGIFVTWGQYYVWSISGGVTQTLVNLPLPSDVPIASYLSILRPIFDGAHGYFIFYALARFWLPIIISFVLSFSLFAVFKTWQSYRGGFADGGPILLLILMIILGFPKILVFIPLGFLFAILLLIYTHFKKDTNIKIESAFIIACFIALFFSNIILVNIEYFLSI